VLNVCSACCVEGLFMRQSSLMVLENYWRSLAGTVMSFAIVFVHFMSYCLQSFDTVGWVPGMAFGLCKVFSSSP